MQFRESEPPTSAGMRAVAMHHAGIAKASFVVRAGEPHPQTVASASASFFARKGDRSRGQKHVAIATSMYREMNTVHWLEQAEAELRQLG